MPYRLVELGEKKKKKKSKTVSHKYLAACTSYCTGINSIVSLDEITF